MVDVAQAVTDWVGDALGDVPCGFGDFPQGADPACMVRASPGDPVVRRYVSGGGEYRFAYEVYLRCPARTDGERYDGLAALRRVQAAVEAKGSWPEADGVLWGSHECTQLPSLYRAEDTGHSTYMLSAYVTWIERG